MTKVKVSGLEAELQQSLDQCQRSLQALQAEGAELQSRDAELRAQELRRLAYLKRRAMGMWANREKAKAMGKVAGVTCFLAMAFVHGMFTSDNRSCQWWRSVLMTRRALGAIQMFKNRALGRAWNSWWGIALEKRQEAIRLELEELRKQSAIDSLELDVLKN